MTAPDAARDFNWAPSTWSPTTSASRAPPAPIPAHAPCATTTSPSAIFWAGAGAGPRPWPSTSWPTSTSSSTCCTCGPARATRAPRARTAAHERKNAFPTALLAELLALPQTQGHAPERQARDTVILLLGVRLGLRLDEMVRLDVADVDLRSARLRVRHGKGHKARTVDLPPGTLAALQTWLVARRAVVADTQVDQGALLLSFQPAARGQRLSNRSLYSVVAGYGQLLGLDETLCGVHALRRTADTRLYRATRDLHVVADVLGHASIATSAVYAKLDVNTRRAALAAAETIE
ncbi:tyrosine-type recombinase/integrase [Deinococcus aerolatus]